MPIPIFSHDRYRLKTNTDIFIDADADTDMVLADTDMTKTDTNLSVSANRCFGLSLNDTTTHVWSKNNQACDLMYVRDFPLSENNGVLISTEHGIKIQVGQKFHYSPCNLLVRQADSQ